MIGEGVIRMEGHDLRRAPRTLCGHRVPAVPRSQHSAARLAIASPPRYNWEKGVLNMSSFFDPSPAFQTLATPYPYHEGRDFRLDCIRAEAQATLAFMQQEETRRREEEKATLAALEKAFHQRLELARFHHQLLMRVN